MGCQLLAYGIWAWTFAWLQQLKGPGKFFRGKVTRDTFVNSSDISLNTSLVDSRSGADLWGRGGGRDAAIQPFSNMLLVFYNFSIISNLFDNNKPYPKARIIGNVRTKCIIFGTTLRIRSKKFKQNLPKICSISTKMATTVCKFLKIFRGSMPPYPPKVFFIPNKL